MLTCTVANAVAYVKYSKASSAALAVENMHEAVLNDGKGPKLKCMFADPSHPRQAALPLDPCTWPVLGFCANDVLQQSILT